MILSHRPRAIWSLNEHNMGLCQSGPRRIYNEIVSFYMVAVVPHGRSQLAPPFKAKY